MSARDTRVSRRSYAYNDTEESSDSDSEISEYDGTNALQIALRDKEEALVQSALARIRRAQEKGKREVKLNQDELDALEKRRKRMQAATTIKEKKPHSSGSDKDRKRSQRQLVPIPSLEVMPRARAASKSSSSKKGKSRRNTSPPPSGIMVANHDGTTTYAPFGYHPSQVGSSRGSPSRPRSSTSQQIHGNLPPHYVYSQGPSSRHFSDGTRPGSSASNSSRRPLPDEESWIPTSSRRSSVASHASVDPFEYQTAQPQYTKGRRIVSGPPEVAYSSIRRSPPILGGYPASPARPVSSSRGASDPTLRRRPSRRDDIDELADSSDEEDESDDLGNGVQVFVEREVEREKAVTRKPVGGKKKGKR
ncbi:hypothetical protein BJ878DRAFT_54418 [Calycina marina]|uniref:Uncharacterized protein n=1 Tax=Calycina marina TaxID=1763456 RepID=A0A9P8CIF0_9HELO|nr:hypothetical protein BJ878DRAFT_54418 [Calycina marina]